MKKNALALLVAGSFLVSLLAVASVDRFVMANFVLLPGYPANIDIQSPQNQTYNVKSVPLNFTVESFNEEHFPTVYSINNQKQVDVDTHMISSRVAAVQVWQGWSSEPNQTENHVLYTLEGNVMLNDLADGAYNVTVQRFLSDGTTVVNSTTVAFTVDANEPETTYFGTEKQPQTFSLVAVFAATITIATIGLLVYFKKIKH